MMDLRYNKNLSLAGRTDLAERAVRHISEYDTLMDIHMDGSNGIMPLLQTTYSRYLSNIETGNTHPLMASKALLKCHSVLEA